MSVTTESAEKIRRRVKEEPKTSSSLAVKRLRKDEAADSDYSSESENGEPRPDKPVHFSRESLFSSRSGFQNYRGLLNDCILLLVLSNSRNVITNLLKYGVLVNPLQWVAFFLHFDRWPGYGLLLVAWIFPAMILKVEQVASKGKLSNRVVAVSHLLILMTHLIFPVVVVLLTRMGPVGSFFSLSWYTVVWLKMVSYVQVNWWCRNSPVRARDDDSERKDKHLVRYPDNLYMKDIVYFCFAPTLCYELNFPRTEKIRKVFLLRRLLEAVFILNVELAIFQQWLLPTALNSLQPFKDMEFTRMVERVLLLAIPNHMFWLLFFYGFFHSILNITAELLRFADRQFYKDWWNSQTIQQFWQTWNIPVHRFAVRHVYSPLVKTHKLSRVTAQAVVFAFSAFFHEYFVSIPLRMLRHWAFLAMMGQVPLGMLTALPYFRGQIGNIIVWTSIVLGQPVAILMYMHDYYWTHWANLAQNATVTG